MSLLEQVGHKGGRMQDLTRKLNRMTLQPIATFVIPLKRPAAHEISCSHHICSAQNCSALINRLHRCVITQRLGPRRCDCTVVGMPQTILNVRTEHDLLGQREVPVAAYYGVQALRGLENFRISGVPLSEPKNRRRH